MKPTVGRTVHYVSHGSPVLPDGTQVYTRRCRAAIVTEVPANPQDSGEAETIGLMVANPTGLFFQSLADGGCPYDEWDGTNALEGAQPQGGSWHWPERETEAAPLAGSGAG